MSRKVARQNRWREQIMLLLFCLSAGVSAQDVSMSFHHLSREAGLSYAANYLVFQDSYKYIWISTDEGLNRFDGQNIEYFSLKSALPSAPASRKVTSRCFEDSDKNLWFSTFSGICCYRRATGQFESFPPNVPDLRGLLDFYVFRLDNLGQLWIRAGSGEKGCLLIFDVKTGQFKRPGSLQGARCTVVTDAANEVVYVVGSMLPDKKPGLTVTDVRNWNTRTVEFTRLPDGKTRRSSTTRGVLAEGDSVLWAGIYNGLGKYNLRTGKTEIAEFREMIGRDFGWIFDVIPYDKSRLLLASAEGLIVFDRLQNKFVQQFRYYPNISGSLRPGVITGLYRDPSDNLWLSGPGGGLDFVQLAKNKFPALPQTIGASVSTLFKDKTDRIWCSTSDFGLYVFDRNQQKLFQANELEIRTAPYGVLSLIGMSSFWEDPLFGLWGFEGNNALRWEETTRRFEFRAENFFGVDGTSSDFIKANYLLSGGTRLVAQGKSIFEVKTGRTKVDLLPWRDLKHLQLQEVTAIFQNKKGHLYLGDNHDRILALDWSGGQTRQLAEFKDAGDCTSFAETEDGLVWAATSKGLFCIDPERLEGKQLSEKTDGVPNEQYYNIVPDRLGQLWLTGNNGLIRYNRQNKTHHRFGTADGLLSNEFRPNAALYVPETGAIWLGGKNGVNVFRPEDIRLLETRPKVQITRLLVNDTAFNAGMDLTLLERLELKYTENTLSFQFSALDFSAPGQNEYYYRMRGVERDSVYNRTSNFVRYANLPPGEYTFEVWATNSDGLLSPEPRRLQLYIRPPFWQTWWFYLLCTAAAAALIYGWFWYRLQQALKIERMRVQISSDLHDDVGTMLAGLAMQSEVLELSARDHDKSKLRRISEISRDAMSRMRDTVWAIDARKDKFENLLDRMREHAEETLTPRDIRFDIRVENVSLKQNLSTNVRQALYLIYKEAATNAAKHSNGDTVSVSLKKSGTGFEMRICDNGRAPEKTYKTTGSGTSNMQMRAEKIGAALTISRENGFCVVLQLPGFG